MMPSTAEERDALEREHAERGWPEGGWAWFYSEYPEEGVVGPYVTLVHARDAEREINAGTEDNEALVSFIKLDTDTCADLWEEFLDEQLEGGVPCSSGT
jgi:hypothetical protein